MANLDSREVAAAKYFKATPEEPSYLMNNFIFAVGAILLIPSCVAMYDWPNVKGAECCLSVLAFAFVVGGAGSRLSKRDTYKTMHKDAEPKPIDEQIDHWFEQDKTRILSEAPNKLGLRPEDISLEKKPLVIVGPANSARFKIGYDGVIRFSAYTVVIIYLSDHHLDAYTCTWDLLTGKTINEQTQEYHYPDIVSVSMLTSRRPFSVITVKGEKHQIQDSQEFSLSATSGESTKVTLGFSQGEDLFKGGSLPPSGAEFAIYTLRMIVRQKKAGVQQQEEGH